MSIQPTDSFSMVSAAPRPDTLADVLERVLDKGIVIVGDIRVNLLDIELLTIKIRLLVASADKAEELGVNWWRGDPFFSHQAVEDGTPDGAVEGGGRGGALDRGAHEGSEGPREEIAPAQETS